MEVIILAGGFGTRLQPIVKDVPKPMAGIGDKPFLFYLLQYISQYKVNRIIMSVGYKHEVIKNYFENSFQNIEIIYVIEDTPLGTGGAIRKALEVSTQQTVVVLNGDTFFKIDLDQLITRHKEKKYGVTLSLKELEDFDRYGTVELDHSGKVKAFHEKKYCKKGFINGGIYAVNRTILDSYNENERFSFEVDFLQEQIDSVVIDSYISSGYFIDIGIPGDYAKAQRELPGIL